MLFGDRSYVLHIGDPDREHEGERVNFKHEGERVNFKHEGERVYFKHIYVIK